jgi:hypothetical protein
MKLVARRPDVKALTSGGVEMSVNGRFYQLARKIDAALVVLVSR